HAQPIPLYDAALKTRVVSFDRSPRFPTTSKAKLSGRSMTLAWILFVFVRSRITVSGVRDKGSATLVQPLGNVHRKPKTLEATPATAELHVTTSPPSRAEVAAGRAAGAARTVAG